MKRKSKIKDELINARVIRDFLPHPEELILKEKKTKITLALNEKSLKFFREQAKKHKASYQAMIRRLLDYYAASHT